jgi:hypothetical protein
MEAKTERVGRYSNEAGAVYSELSQGWRDNSEGPVLSDLLKDVPRLMSEEPTEILRFLWMSKPYMT